MKVSNIHTEGKSLFEILQQSFCKDDQGVNKVSKSNKLSGYDASLWSYNHKTNVNFRKCAKYPKRKNEKPNSNLKCSDVSNKPSNLSSNTNKDYSCTEPRSDFLESIPEKEDFELSKCYTDYEHEEIKKTRRNKLQRKQIGPPSEDEDALSDPQPSTIKEAIPKPLTNKMKTHYRSESPPYKRKPDMVNYHKDSNIISEDQLESENTQLKMKPVAHNNNSRHSKCNIPLFKKDFNRLINTNKTSKEHRPNTSNKRNVPFYSSSGEVSSNESTRKYSKERQARVTSNSTSNSIVSGINHIDSAFFPRNVNNHKNVASANDKRDSCHETQTIASAKFSNVVTMETEESESQMINTPIESKKVSSLSEHRPVNASYQQELERHKKTVEKLLSEKRDLQRQLSHVKKEYEAIIPKYNILLENSKDFLLIDTERKNLAIKNQELEKKVKTLSSLVEDTDTKKSCLEEQLKQFERDRIKMLKEAELLKAQLENFRQQSHESGSENEKKNALRKLEQENDLKIRQMHNKIIELKGNIRVIARFKLEVNSAQGDTLSNSEYYHFTGTDSVILTHKLLENDHNFFLSSRPQRTYSFNRVFRPTSRQEDVFNEVSPYITSCIDGYNVCIMTYGQTGSGKTFTMKGTNKSPGIIPRAVQQIFKECQERKIWTYDLFISILQIYNENMTDLLTETINRVYIQDDGSTVFIKGLQEFRVRNEDDIKHYIKLGRKRRTTAKTILNFDSSRSHFVVMLRVFGSSLLKNYETQGILTLCDLAGFERFSAVDPYGKQATETKYISKSLTVLARVFEALRTKRRSIPFRESKLTHLLKPSLSGDAKCVLILTLSTKPDNVESSLRSLEFGTKAMVTALGPAKKNVTQMNEEDEYSDDEEN